MPNTVTSRPLRMGASIPHAMVLAVLAALVADLTLRFSPTGFAGGGTDDQRYLEAALAWYRDGIAPGKTHWALRHPLILAVLASFKMFGPTTDAMLLVPRLAWALLVAVTTGGLARFAGLRAAALWVLLAVLSPIMHEMATSCFPEMVELAFSAVSLWAFLAARGAGRGRIAWLLLSGLAAGLAILTRETAVVLPLVYGIAFLWRPGMSRGSYTWIAAGLILPIAIDTLWLWQQTGDALYRYHIDSGHIHIASAHLRGGVYTGVRGPILNFDLASRWVPSGPLPIHWSVDPLINLIIDPRFGLIFLAWGVLAWGRGRGDSYDQLRPLLIGVALLSFVLTTWVLMLRPQPRYYLLATYAATIGVALLSGKRRVTIIMLTLVALAGFVTIALSRNQQRPAELIVPYVASHSGFFYVDPKVRARIDYSLDRAGLATRVGGDEVPIGGIRIRLLSEKLFKLGKPFDRPGYAPLETTLEPRPLFHRLLQSPTVALRPALRIERRVK